MCRITRQPRRRNPVRFGLGLAMTIAMAGPVAARQADKGVEVSEVSVVPTIISGTLSPFAVAVDGNMIFRGNEVVSRLFVNETEIPIDDKGPRAFFYKTQ